MKTKINLLILITMLLTGSASYAQDLADTIQVKKKFGTVFVQHGRYLTSRHMLEIMEPNPAAYKEMKTARSNYTAAMVLAYPGGALLGWPLGTAIAGGDPNWVMAGIGAGLIAISIPLSSAYVKHAKRAVDIYNTGLTATSRRKVDVNLRLTGNGVGVRMTF